MSLTSFQSRAALVVALAALSLAATAPLAAANGTSYVPKSHLGPVPAGAFYLSPNGSDANAGTRAAPWRTLAKAQSQAKAGDTVVLLPGDYGAMGTTTTMSKSGSIAAPITYRGEPGAALPRILGFFKITGSYQRFNHLLFDGPTGQTKAVSADNPGGEQVQVSVYGPAVDGVEISDSEIRESGWHAGIYLSTANDVRITGNYIHDNGNFSDPAQANQSHGIYFASGSGLIANNVIEHNVARGVQLYSSPRDVTVANNTIVRNGKSGIQFGAATARSRAVNNLVAYNGEYGIRGASLTGIGNEVRNNLVWGNSKGNLAFKDGLLFAANTIAKPGFGRTGSYRPPASSRAVDKGSPILAPTADFDGKARDLAPDIGAFEVG